MNRSHLLPIVALAALSVAVTLGIALAFDSIEHLALYLGITALMILVVTPIVVKLLHGSFDLGEVTLVYSMVYFLFYGAGALFVLFVPGAAYDSGIIAYLDLAVWACVLGYACLLLGYYTTARFVPARTGRQGARPGWLGLGLVYSIGLAGHFVKANLEGQRHVLNALITPLSSLLSQLSFLDAFALFYAFLILMLGRAERAFVWLLFGWMVPTQLVILYLNVGNKSTFLLIAGLPLLAHWYARGRVPWKGLLASVLITMFVIFPVYYTFRNIRGTYYSREYRLKRSIENLSERETGEYFGDALQTVARRLSIINSPAVVIRECGSRVEHQWGRTLWLSVISITIPRFVWPEKPNINIGFEFARTFHITGFGNLTMVAMSSVGELYWNFHIPGVILGMFLLGLWFRVLYKRFGLCGTDDPLRLAIYVTLLTASAIGAEGTLAGYVGLLVKEGVILLVLERTFVSLRDATRRDDRGIGVQPSAVVAP